MNRAKVSNRKRKLTILLVCFFALHIPLLAVGLLLSFSEPTMITVILTTFIGTVLAAVITLPTVWLQLRHQDRTVDIAPQAVRP